MAKGPGADTIKLRILRWRDCLGLFWWAQCNHGVLISERRRQESERETGLTKEAEIGLIKLLMGATSQGMQTGSRSWKGKKPFSPRASRRNAILLTASS